MAVQVRCWGTGFTAAPPCCCLQDVTQEDFPLPTLGPKLKAIIREVTHGRGFKLITGVQGEGVKTALCIPMHAAQRPAMHYMQCPGLPGTRFA